MGIFNFFNKKEDKPQTIVASTGPDYQSFSTPFGTIGKGNLALPFVRDYVGANQYVRFGNDNLYPQLINQMYQQSPLNGAIINMKRNAVMGGGFEVEDVIKKDGKEKVKEYSFIKRNHLKDLVNKATLDLIMHGRITILVCDNGKEITLKRLGPETVRNNADASIFTISDDWATSRNMRCLPAYRPNILGESILEFSPGKGEAGQDIYALPQYCSALNSAFLNGEIPFLQKSNLINSIFPSFMLTMAKVFQSDAEVKQFKQTIEDAKGAQEAGRILAFVSNSADSLPTITPIPVSNNDSLFKETIDNVQINICQAHGVHPQLINSVTGKLGSGAELPMLYAMFEKNQVLPLKEQMKDFIEELFFVAGIPVSIKINEYKIVDDVIKQQQ